MKKRFLSALLCLCMVVGMLPEFTTTAQAAVDYYIDYDLSDTSNEYYTADGSYQLSNTWGKQLRCTYVAWEEAKNRLGIMLPKWGDAQSWAQNAKNFGYQTGSIPAVNSILCQSGGDWGHVAFVTEVNGSTITVTEGGYGPNTYPKAHVRTIGESGWNSGTFIYLKPSASRQNIGEDFYAYIRNTHSGLGVENHSNNVQLATADNYDPRQIWHFIHLGWSQYKIINMYDGRCLSVDGTNVRALPFTSDSARQFWEICGTESHSNSTLYYLSPPTYGEYGSGHTSVLDVANGHEDYVPAGRNVQFSSKNWYGGSGSTFINGGPFHRAQTFQVVKISNIETVLTQYARSKLGSDFYARISYGNTYLQTSGVVVGGDQMAVQTTQRSASTDPRQIWHFVQKSNGTYQVTNEYNGWSMGATGTIAADGAKVQTYSNRSTGNWYAVQSPGDSTYRLVTGLGYIGDLFSLDVPVAQSGMIPPEGTNMTICCGHENTNQQFSISSLSYTRPAAPSAPTSGWVSPADTGTTISWRAVPSVGSYDSRYYQLQVYDSGGDLILNIDTLNTSYTTSSALPTGSYTIKVRAVNTKYDSSSANYASGYYTWSASIDPYRTVSVNATAGGTVTGGGTYRDGNAITVTATPQAGYHFVKWTENGAEVSADASYGFTVNADRSLTAVFEQDAPPTPASYTVSIAASEGGTVSGGGSFTAGTSVTVIATANEGYQFVRWTEDGHAVSSNASYTFTIGANRTLTAVFEQTQVDPPEPTKYTVSVTASPTSGGTVTGGGTYAEGTSVTVTAMPNSGYQFKGWTENGTQVTANASYTLTNLTEAHALTAIFEKEPAPVPVYTVTVNATAGGTATGGGSYTQGAAVTVTAAANSGYRFTGWTENGSVVSTDASYHFTASGNRALTAAFEQENAPVPTVTYTVEVNADPAAGGTVTGEGAYTEGASITVAAAANSGYQFVRWVESGETVSANSSYTFTVNSNRTLTAIFESTTPAPKPTYTITVNTVNPAQGTVSGGGSYEEGQTVTISAVPNDGYQFVEWQLSGRRVSAAASHTFMAGADQTYTAIFEERAETPPTPVTAHSVSVAASPAAGGTVTGGGSHEGNTFVTVTAAPNSGYRFVRWTEGGREVSTGASYTFAVTADRALIAEFATTTSNPVDPGPSNPGNSTSDPGSNSSNTPALPVSTDKVSSGGTTITETVASPSAAARNGAVEVTISSAIASEIIKQAVANGSGEVIIAPEITGSVTRAEVSIPAATVGEIGRRTEASLTIATPVASVTIPNTGLASLSDMGGTVTVTAGKTSGEVELSITAGGRTVDSISGSVALTVPMTNTTPGTVAVLIHEDGTRETIRKSVAGGGSVTVPLNGSAKLEIVDNAKTFADVGADSWAADAVAFASGHELFNGTSANTFSPDTPMTRGMLAVVLHNLESNPDQALNEVFQDVGTGAWYSKAITWAAANGIVGGYGNGLFGPSDNITREQLAVMLWRYAGSPAATDKELHFTDADKASRYALDALRWAVENGIINGYGDGRLAPQGLATRAQVAQMLMNFLKDQ